MSETLITLIINAVMTPLFVILTLWARSIVSSKNHAILREDGFIAGMDKRIMALEKELREVRIELKNRDADYLELYKEHTTLKAKYEVLQVDHEQLKKEYGHTVEELTRLGTTAQPLPSPLIP